MSAKGKQAAGSARRVREEIVGICADAKALGVSRMHLWAVLNGRRESEPLLRRYHALKSGRAS